MIPRNQIQVAQGETATFEVSYYQYSGGPLIDPSPTPTYVIYNSDNVVVASGTGTRTSIGKYTTTYLVASSATVAKTWRIEWTAYISGLLVPDNWEYFEVITAGSGGLSDITITDDWIQQIKKVLAYPDVNEILLADDQIRSLCVRQALHQYFVKFPKKVWNEYDATNETIIDFPDAYTFGILDCRVLGKGYAGTSGGSFWDMVMWNQTGYGSNFKNMYGSNVKGYNPNSLRQTRFIDQQVNNTLINQGTFKYRVDQILRKVYIYSSISAKCNVTWAKHSANFDDVLFQFQWDVVKLSQGYLLLHLADTAGIIDDTVLEAKIDIAGLKERGKELISEITEKWLEYPDPIAIIH
jgi:hypothetical protein